MRLIRPIDIADYDNSGYDYMAYWRNRQYEDRAEHLALKKLLPPRGQSIIDLGGGYGRLTDLYLDRFDSATLFDYSQESLDRAPGNPKLQKIRGDVYQLPFPDETFKVALIVRLIHHLLQPERALTEVSRILKPGGLLILEFANKIHLKNRLRYWLKGDFGFSRNQTRLDLSVRVGESEGIFFNYHPSQIREMLTDNHFQIVQKISVSNLRLPLLKQVVPLKPLLFAEQVLQEISCLAILKNGFYLGPSIFLKCQKAA